MANNLAKLASNEKCLAITGMGKNTGKTTVLNYLLNFTENDCDAVTSIGYDGEETDQVTATSKPAIFVKAGTIVATARELIKFSDFTREILYATNFHTALGEVIVMRAKTSGFVRLAGPSIMSDMSALVKMLHSFGAVRVIIDGALARKTSLIAASSCILATGAAFSLDVEHLITQTCFFADLFRLNAPSEQIVEKFCGHFINVMNGDKNENRCLICQNDLVIDAGSSLEINTAKVIARCAEEKAFVLFDGVVTFRIVDYLLKTCKNIHNLCFIAKDPSRYIISSCQFYQLRKRNVLLYVLNPIRLVAITFNPFALNNLRMDCQLVVNRLQKLTGLPVINVLEGETCNTTI